MTRSEAHQIVVMLKLGRTFGVRGKEQEWELNYLGGGVFEKRGSLVAHVPVAAAKFAEGEGAFRDTMSEVDLIPWLCRSYSFEGLLRCCPDRLE